MTEFGMRNSELGIPAHPRVPIMRWQGRHSEIRNPKCGTGGLDEELADAA
jgi:hypothetical protein